jgi:hypothetical protein
MADCNEYRRLGQQVNWPYMTQEDLTLAHSDLASMISEVQNNPEFVKARTRSLQDVVRDQCSFEKTTKKVLKYIF